MHLEPNSHDCMLMCPTFESIVIWALEHDIAGYNPSTPCGESHVSNALWAIREDPTPRG